MHFFFVYTQQATQRVKVSTSIISQNACKDTELDEKHTQSKLGEAFIFLCYCSILDARNSIANTKSTSLIAKQFFKWSKLTIFRVILCMHSITCSSVWPWIKLIKFPFPLRWTKPFFICLEKHTGAKTKILSRNY